MLRGRRWLVPLLILSSILGPWPHPNASGDQVRCQTGETFTPYVVRGKFHTFRPGAQGFDFTWRDVEFMWGASYSGGMSADAQATLRNMAGTLVTQTGQNAFGANLSKIRLIYNYFRTANPPGFDVPPQGPTYNTTNPLDSTSLAIGRDTWDYNNIDKSHADCYVAAEIGSRRLSIESEAAEDSTTGHPVNLGDIASTDVKPSNSIAVAGPAIGSHIDPTGTGWTGPESQQVLAFLHEFQHAISPVQSNGYMMDEMFSDAAEAVTGNHLMEESNEVPYTWPLVMPLPAEGCDAAPDCCQNPRDVVANNDQGRSMFTGYLAYNFRGTDTSASPAGLNDDLLRRWSRNTVVHDDFPDRITRHWKKFVELMGDDSCGAFLGKNYVHPGGQSLPNYDRAQLLHHNWRVANYVNRSDLPGTEGQYGFPPEFGFSPAATFKAWQSFDGCLLDDVVSIPPVVTMTNDHVSQEMNLRVKREFRENWHPMRLHLTGAEYWVVRADTAALGVTPRDLVITVSSDSVWRSRLFPTGQRDGRLMASVIGYTLRAPDAVESPQWQNPSWAQLALEPKWVDVDSLPAELVFVVPSFGITYKAAVVVITLGDGPSRDLENSRRGWEGYKGFVMPYRMSLALRGAPNDTLPNPRGLHVETAITADCPAWSPASDEVAFVRTDTTTGLSRIYRKKLDATPASPLLSGSDKQFDPAWSPRGDWIAFTQDSGGGGLQRNLWLYQVGTGTTAVLTNRPGWETSAAFSPNGQHVAYAYFPIVGGGAQDRWELRRVDLNGGNDVALLSTAGVSSEIRSVRWSPDGAWVFFTRQDSLYAISKDGGAVVPRPGLLAKGATLDFHLSGTHRFVAEQTGNAGSIQNPQSSPVAFRRLVLRDSVAADTRGRFYRTGAQFSNPRWSPDGIRVAYSSNQNTANISNDRDLFVGQISYNQPPQFVGLGDHVLSPGSNFQLALTATDPNGEALSYAMPALYLPSGATFASGTLTWNNVGPQTSRRFLVARAFDGSGGVANRVIRLDVTLNAVGDLSAELVSDTQAWPTWSAPGESGISGVEYDLRYATFPITESNWNSAYRCWNVPTPGPAGSYQEGTVSGLSPCTPYYFALKTLDANGNWSASSNVTFIVTACGGGGGFRAEQRGPTVAGGGHGSLEGASQALVVEMGMEGEAPVWTLTQLSAEDAAVLSVGDTVSVLRQVRNGQGEWSDRSQIKSAIAPWRFAVRALRHPGRLVFFGSYGARQTWNSVGLEQSDAVASLVATRHSRLGTLDSFNQDGSTTLDVNPGDTLELRYQTIESETQAKSDWYLLVGPPGSEVTTPAFRRPGGRGTKESPTTLLPTAFALRQNQPNPFSKTTDIRFELPVATPVRLEVFDLQGRRVATLAAGAFPAGFHTVLWDRRDVSGVRVKPGIYLYRLEAGSFHARRKMTVFP